MDERNDRTVLGQGDHKHIDLGYMEEAAISWRDEGGRLTGIRKYISQQ